MLIEISMIIVPERVRKIYVESPKFLELKESIEKRGLITPIAVKLKYTVIRAFSGDVPYLVCGARRLEACKQLGMKEIEANIITITNDTEHLLCELEENIRREDFTWQEQVLASGKLFEAVSATDKTIDLVRFSVLLQQSNAKTSNDMDMYDNRFLYPTIFMCETWSRAREELRRLKVADLAAEKVRRQRSSIATSPLTSPQDAEGSKKGGAEAIEIVSTIPSAIDMVYWTALQLLESLEDNTVDVICTDPPFGIDIQGGRHRRTQKAVYEEEYKDTVEDYFKIIRPCLAHFARVLKPGAHLYMFFGIENLALLRDALEQEGFKVHKVPLIWHRVGSGAAANQPYYYPGSAYQAIMYAFAPGERRRLQKQGESNVITLPTLPPQKKVHPLEIPIHIYADLICRSACLGDLMIDPFCGTGNSLVAGLWARCRVLGAEIREDYRNLAVLNLEDRLIWEQKMNKSMEGKG